MEYFSDGWAGQYKNFKNFKNLSYHEKDFGSFASWSFFATGHGKSPCDGIRGVVKRKLTRESLIRRHGKEILTSLAAYDYCANTLHDVKCVHLDEEDLCICRNKLVERYSKGNTWNTLFF